MNTHVCDAQHAKYLDISIRKWFHNPYKMFQGLIKSGDTVVDIGCGPGTFTIEMSHMAGETGGVVAVDLQQEMLNMCKVKAEKKGLSTKIKLHKCDSDKIALDVQADFILAFYMVHELPDQAAFFKEVAAMLKPGGLFLMVEPIFHVTKQDFKQQTALAQQYGLSVDEERKITFSKSVVLKKAD